MVECWGNLKNWLQSQIKGHALCINSIERLLCIYAEIMVPFEHKLNICIYILHRSII